MTDDQIQDERSVLTMHPHLLRVITVPNEDDSYDIALVIDGHYSHADFSDSQLEAWASWISQELGCYVAVGPQRDIPLLWGAAEAAACLGVSQTNLRVIKGLPEPVQKIAATTLWLADDIRMFALQRKLAKKQQQPAA